MVRLICILSLGIVPIGIYALFRSGLAALAGGVWVVAVLMFWRWFGQRRQ
jgi:hypothetical protein